MITGETLEKKLCAIIRRIYHITTLEHFHSQKVSGANILFFGLGDGTTGQFEYVDDDNWKISLSQGEIE